MSVNLERIMNPEYEICLCRHVKTKDIIKFIEDNHITSLSDLCLIAKVGDKCGGCREELDAILSSYTF